MEKEVIEIKRHDGKDWVSFVPKKDVKGLLSHDRVKKRINKLLEAYFWSKGCTWFLKEIDKIWKEELGDFK